jgi:hypothetical protein
MTVHSKAPIMPGKRESTTIKCVGNQLDIIDKQLKSLHKNLVASLRDEALLLKSTNNT